MSIHTKAIQKAVKFAKGQRALARLLTKETGEPISQAHIWGWINEVKRFPPEMCAPIEKITAGSVTRQQLRPDLFGDAF